MTIVLDSSFALAIALGEAEAMQHPEYIDLIAREGAVVPALWLWEFANGLIMAYRRNRATRADIASQFAEFSAMPISIDETAQLRAFSACVALADKHQLTAYDAAYLELAQRLSLRLATFDKALAKAAREEEVEVIGT